MIEQQVPNPVLPQDAEAPALLRVGSAAQAPLHQTGRIPIGRQPGGVGPGIETGEAQYQRQLDPEPLQVPAGEPAADPLEAAARGRAGEQAKHAGDNAGDPRVQAIGELHPHPAALGDRVRIEQAERAMTEDIGGADGGPECPGSLTGSA